MTLHDLDDMRSCGLNDRDIPDINQVTAHFAYVNRVADGLGVRTDDYAENRVRRAHGHNVGFIS